MLFIVVSGLEQLDGMYQSVTEREKGHIDVVRVFVRQDHPTACRMWSQLTVDYPTGVSERGGERGEGWEGREREGKGGS